MNNQPANLVIVYEPDPAKFQAGIRLWAKLYQQMIEREQVTQEQPTTTIPPTTQP